MRKFKTWRDPYDMGFTPTYPREIEIQSGLTILVGCNGAGKTTLLRNIKYELKEAKIPYLYYDNLSDGGSTAVSAMFYKGNIEGAVTVWGSSEGEAIGYNICNVAGQIREFIITGETEESKEQKKWASMFGKEEETDQEVPKERWILLDAIDSGYSIDNVVELKDLINLIFEDSAKVGIDMHILASANAYELASGENCFDVNAGKYLTFENYDDYKKFILKSRKKKDKRYK